MLVGERLKKIRKVLCIRQSTIAEHMNITQQSLSHLENRPSITTDSLFMYCEAMNIQPWFVVSDIEITSKTVSLYGHKQLSNLINAAKHGENTD